MRRRVRVMVAAVLLGLLAMSVATAATAGVEAKGGKPSTTTAPPVLYTCQDRIDNGAIWVKGEYDEALGHYVVGSAVGEPIALPACFDLLPEHSTGGQWTVTWSGTVAGRLKKGLELRFEKGLHGVIYDRSFPAATSGAWITKTLDPDPDYFVFVAMPAAGERWTSIEMRLYPPDSQP